MAAGLVVVERLAHDVVVAEYVVLESIYVPSTIGS